MQATIFHYGSVSLIKEPCRSAHLAAMNVAKMSGSILSYVPNVTLPLWPTAEAAGESIMSIWNYADIIKVHFCVCIYYICEKERERERTPIFGPGFLRSFYPSINAFFLKTKHGFCLNHNTSDCRESKSPILIF